MGTAPILESLRGLQAAVDDVLKSAEAGGFGSLDDDEFAEAARDVEAIRRQLATADYPVIEEVQTRGLPATHLARTTAGYLGLLWRLTPHEANTRVKESKALGSRSALSGELLDPLRPVTAAARRAGVLGASQVSVITKTLNDLPDALPVEEVDAAETTLVRAAHSLHTNDLAKVARHLLDVVNPDGDPPSEEEKQRKRDFWLQRNPDGTIRFGGRFDPATGATADAWFGAMSKPRPDDITGTDERTAGQRRHDSFADLLGLALRASQYTDACGNPVTVHVSMTAEQFTAGTGHATTSYGQPIHINTAFYLADQACVAWVVHNTSGGILNFGRGRRLATHAQTEALLLRDGGCAFPGCDHPAEWCERHHIREWRNGGPTDIDNLVLMCAYHHARFDNQGWQIVIREGIPWFIPPPLIDPDQKPLRNIRGKNANPFEW